MRILVLLEVGADVRVPPQLHARSGRVREEWLVRQPDPACERALALALGLAAGESGAEVTVVHLGPAQGEPWLRRALAAGATSAMRVWSDERSPAPARPARPSCSLRLRVRRGSTSCSPALAAWSTAAARSACYWRRSLVCRA